MDAPPGNRLGSLSAAIALLGLCLVAAVPLTWAAYSRSHLENQGVDVVLHLIMVNEQAAVGEDVLNEFAPYPQTSHRLAAWAAPLFGGDPLLGMRYVACATMLALLALPYVLLCRAFRPLPALALLLAWHVVCHRLKVGGMSHFLDMNYNYSRAVGTVGFWMALVALCTPARGPLARLGCHALAAGCGCFALACHLGPGAVTFGAVLAFQAVWWLRDRSAVHLAGLGFTAAAAAGMSLVGVWQFMVSAVGHNGSLVVGPPPVLLLWVPVLLAAVVLSRRADGPEAALTSGLLAAGTLQAYLAARVATGGAAPYGMKTLYYLTFPAALLLLLVWARRLALRPPGRVTVGVAVVLLAGLLGLRWWKHDGGLWVEIKTPLDGPLTPSAERRPMSVTRRLGAAREALAGYYYFDPQQPYASYYANMAGLRTPYHWACPAMLALSGEEGAVTAACRDELAAAGFAGLALPACVDPSRYAPGMGPAVRTGDYWLCPLPAALARRR